VSTPTPRVHVIVATHEPRREHLAAQIDSIRTQVGVELSVHVVDDGSAPDTRTMVRSVVGDDDRFELLEFDRVGVLRNIERALRLVPEGVDAILLADQDDVWVADKALRLSTALAAGHLLVHSDATLIDDGGATIAPSLFAHEGRDVDDVRVGDLVVRNVVTGCTAAIAPALVAPALPFPAEADDAFHHDLWLALCAASLGTIGVVRDPLTAYRQHGANVVGAVEGYGRWRGMRAAVGAWRLRRSVATSVVAAARAGRLPAVGWPARAWTGPVAEVTSLPAIALFALDRPGSRRLALELAAGAVGSLARRLRAAPGSTGVASARKVRKVLAVALHAARHPREVVNIVARTAGISDDGPVRVVAPSERAPQQRALRTVLRERDTRVVNVLIPGISPSGVFGGVATAVAIAAGLAERGERVRLVLCDFGQSLSDDQVRAIVLRHVALSPDALARLEVTNQIRDDRTLDVGVADVFLATAWWTAWRAAATIAAEPALAERRVHYLVQDYEPLFYPASERQLEARRSYDLDALLLVNSTPLADFLADELGVAIDPALVLAPLVAVPERSALRTPPSGTEPLRVVVYGRPSVGRNLFETALRGIALWVEARGAARAVEVMTIGERLPVRHVIAGREVRDLGVLSWEAYLGLLATSHLGVSLMTSPHPSYPPLEMAMTGMVVVTNRWGPKDLARVSDRLVSCEPDAASVAAALAVAEERLAAGGDPPIDLASLGADLDAFLDAYRAVLVGGGRSR